MIPRLLALACAAALPGCGGGAAGVASGVGACGGPPPAPGADGCALACRAVIPVQFTDGAPRLPVWINGKPVVLTFDTGASSTLLTSAAVADLRLPAPRTLPGSSLGIGGQQPRRATPIDSLAFAGLSFGAGQIGVADFAKSDGPRANPNADGSLGMDVLSRFEIDLDMPHGVVTLYHGRACGGLLPGWIDTGYTVPFTTRGGAGQPIVPIRLDGHELAAILDSGASVTVADPGFIHRLHVSDAELNSELNTGGIGFGPDVARGRSHLFRSLDVGPEHFPDFEAAILSLHMMGPEALLGEDFLRQHKVWISNARHELVVSNRW